MNCAAQANSPSDSSGSMLSGLTHPALRTGTRVENEEHHLQKWRVKDMDLHEREHMTHLAWYTSAG